jgi:hypothetical protein
MNKIDFCCKLDYSATSIQCRNPGTIRYNGRLYCAEHDPRTPEERKISAAVQVAVNRMLRECWDAAAAHTIGNHILFKQTHPNKETWIANAMKDFQL